MNDTLQAFDRLIEIVAELRVKCPWDREQSKESIRHLTIEEAHELSEAILRNDYDEIKTELGDLLLHVVFYANMIAEEKRFELKDVITALCEKLIRRHPHVYGDVQVNGATQVAENWEQIKAKEKKDRPRYTLDGVPEALPSLIMAYRMQEKAAKMGFDWEHAEQVWDKVEEEIGEFQAAETLAEKEAEMGDVFFSLVNYCRWQGINPDDALSRTNLKFRRRYAYIEQQAMAQGRNLKDMTLAEMDVLWEAAKTTV